MRFAMFAVKGPVNIMSNKTESRGHFSETLLYGGPIYTMTGTSQDPAPVEALLVRDGKVVMAGPLSHVEALAGKGCRRIDLEGRAVYPGFEDCHIHLAQYCQRLSEIDLFFAKTLEEALDIMRERALTVKPGEWVRGGGWDKNVWGGFPTAKDLDRVFPANPVILGSKDGHSCWANSEAMKLAGITRDTAAPPGGAILRDPDGNPTGIFQDNAEFLVWRAVPPDDTEHVISALDRGFKELLKMGVTAVQVAEGPETLRALQIMRERGQLPLRVTMTIPLDALDHARALGLRFGLGDEWLRLGPIKMFKDGSLGASTAYMFEPYEGSDSYVGLETLSPEETDDAVRRAVEAGFPVAMHAIGDRACHEALDAIEKWGKPMVPEAFHRIEHAQLLLPEDIKRMGKLGVIASVQPGHASADRYMADRQWGKRARYAYAFRSLHEAGSVLAFGSDAPVEIPDPLLGIYSAVFRKRPSEPESAPWYPEETLSMFQAVAGYTRGAAFAAGQSSVRGTLESGKLADLVILSGDLFAAREEEVMGLEVRGVMVGGEFVLAPCQR